MDDITELKVFGVERSDRMTGNGARPGKSVAKAAQRAGRLEERKKSFQTQMAPGDQERG